jgi:glucokinase
VLGLDFGGTKIAAAVCDLVGNRLASATVSAVPGDGQATSGPATATAPSGPATATAPSGPATATAPSGPATATAPSGPATATAPSGPATAQAIFDRGIAAARDLLGRAAPGAELAAVGAATFGIPSDDRVGLAPAIAGWESVAFGRGLRAAFAGAEIRMATDAKAAAAAEARWGALNDCDPGIYLNLGTGLAAAIVLSGKVLGGRNGAAGEIGYNLRTLADVGRGLDQRSPLEDLVSGQGLASQSAGAGGVMHALTAAEIFNSAADDPKLRELVRQFVEELAFHLVNLAIVVNPERIAVGGGMVRSWDHIRPRLQHALSAAVPFPPELVVARFPHDAPLLGAVAMAIDAARTRASAADGRGQSSPTTDGGARPDATADGTRSLVATAASWPVSASQDKTDI